jgi:putative methionine-R-sulfoxide reductase with GAF domain
MLAANRPSFNHSPLEQVAHLLCEGRHYSWVGIYLRLDSESSPALLQDGGWPHPAQIAMPGTRKKILVSMKIAGHEIGYLNAESDRENSFGAEDRVLLDRVAGLLTRFLSGPGRYLVRRAAKPELVPTKAAAA